MTSYCEERREVEAETEPCPNCETPTPKKELVISFFGYCCECENDLLAIQG